MLPCSFVLMTLFTISLGEISISLLPRSFMFSKDRDGILIVTLEDGVNATVCNTGFTDIYATKACVDMGYTMKGLTVVSKRSQLVKDMKMIALTCIGEQGSLRGCNVTTDSLLLRSCKAKKRVVHVLCLGKKVKPYVQNFKSETICNINSNDNNVKLLTVQGKKNTGYLQIKDSSSNSYKFVCNKYLNFGLDQARLFCNLLCQNSFNPRPVMYLNPGSVTLEDGYYKDMECPESATSLDQCTQVSLSTPCDMSHNVALQCGDEPIYKDPAPSIVCSDRSMIIEWSRAQSFVLNSSLVSLHSNHTTDNCLYTKSDTSSHVIIKIPLDYCSPIVTDNEDTVTFMYIIDRMYASNEMVQFKTKESINVFCKIPKYDMIVKEYAHGDITYPPVKDDTRLKVILTLHEGLGFKKLLPVPYNIEFYNPVYAKATILKPLSQIKLSLMTCFVTSADSYSAITSLNSAKIIDENCPIEKYGVQIVPINKWSIAFQFTAFKLLESDKATVNIFCETMKCLVLDDPDCGVCKVGSRRTRRSANLKKASVIRVGPIMFH